MRELYWLIDQTSLFERLCQKGYLRIGFKQVKRNKGSPGIDGKTISDFDKHLEEELSQLKAELENWTYQPSPVRRVEILKPGGKASDYLVYLRYETEWFMQHSSYCLSRSLSNNSQTIVMVFDRVETRSRQ